MSKHIPVTVNVTTKRYIPQHIRLVEILMNESIAMLARHGEPFPNARKLSHEFIGSVFQQLQHNHIYFGKNSASETHMKHWAILDDYNNGKTVDQLAIKYSLSTRHIYSIIANPKNIKPDKATTTGAPAMAISATRMMLKAGVDPDDAISAVRGLLAIVAAKLGGTAIVIPKPMYVEGILKQIEIVGYYQAGKSIDSLATRFGLSPEEIRDIVKNYPAATIPDASDLPKIKTRLFNMSANFSGYTEINTLLESATEQISRAEQIITNLKGEQPQCRYQNPVN